MFGLNDVAGANWGVFTEAGQVLVYQYKLKHINQKGQLPGRFIFKTEGRAGIPPHLTAANAVFRFLPLHLRPQADLFIVRP